MKKRTYTLKEVENLSHKDIFNGHFWTDGMCYIFSEDDDELNITALDWIDEDKISMSGAEIESVLQYVCDCLNCIPHEIRDDVKVKEVNSCGDACILLTNGMMLRVRGWGHLTSTYVDYGNPDHSVPVNQERHLEYIQNTFAVYVARRIDPDYDIDITLREQAAKLNDACRGVLLDGATKKLYEATVEWLGGVNDYVIHMNSGAPYVPVGILIDNYKNMVNNLFKNKEE